MNFIEKIFTVFSRALRQSFAYDSVEREKSRDFQNSDTNAFHRGRGCLTYSACALECEQCVGVALSFLGSLRADFCIPGVHSCLALAFIFP